MRICLINPAWTFCSPGDVILSNNLGICYLASYLQKYGGHEIQIVDGLVEGFDQRRVLEDGTIKVGLTDEEIIKRIDLTQDMIGITVPFSYLAKSAEELCRCIKRVFPDTPIIMGGVHPSTSPELFQESAADYWLRGEGEMALLALANGTPAKEIQGLMSSEKPVLHPKEKAEQVGKLDDIPVPARDLLPMDLYKKLSPRRVSHTTSASLITSRGCPWDCEFCSIHPMYGYKWRMHSADYVLAEVRELVERWGVRGLEFEDDNLTIDYDRTIEIFEGLCKLQEELGVKLTWGTPNGIRGDRTLDRDMLGLMKRSGCVRLTFALEHADERVRESMQKRLDVETFERNLRDACDLGLFVEVFAMVGYPGETQECFETSRKYYRQLSEWGVNVMHFFYPNPYPGTQLYDLCKEKGYLVVDENALFPRVKIETEDFDTAEVIRRREILLSEFDRTYKLRQRVKAIVPQHVINLANRYFPRKQM